MTALSQRREWWLLVTLGAVQFASVLDFMILMPLGAQLMRLFDLTPQQFGLLVSVYMITASAAGFAVSFVVDRFDRRAMLLVLCACFTATTVLTAMAQSYAWLLLARATAGAFGGLLVNDKAPGQSVEEADPRSGKMATIRVGRAQREFGEQSKLLGK